MSEPAMNRRDLLGAAGLGAVPAGAAQGAPPDLGHGHPAHDLGVRTLFHVDPDRKMAEQPIPGHNRLHPDIPAVVEVAPGDEFRVECQEWTDNQVGNNDSAEDDAHADLHAVHMLSGPFRIKGAEPGDLLVVDVLDIGPMRGWGYTGIFPKTNGGGFLTDHFPDAHKAVWDFYGVYATSRHLPGVKFAGLSHPGQLVTAPPPKLLDTWNARERALIDTDPDRVPPLAYPPSPDYALAGTASGNARDRIARECARTVPPRESGGNIDMKNLTRGARIYLPVHVEGGNLSVGDLHFSQGDGEITFCGAIEMAGWIHLGVDLIKGGMALYQQTTPMIARSPLEPHHSDYLCFSGLSVKEDGTQTYLDANVAYRNACLSAIRYLTTVLDDSPQQAYLLLGAAPIVGRVAGIVDIPNAFLTVELPTAIFDRDILPGAGGER
ncbi:formamidase [Tautonia plasticadhaerens]|uniref:Formamidase n=1 Tax=Tautonia plasticadhaerens TaxID=2527974 RepID=A0A518H0N0_9BACT|nr:formamidase [Tautonia plasticadhaerens]QDV34400.1 Formamidase [Tautonia plasticadhaerens]